MSVAIHADRPIADYGLIGDMRGAALVATDGSIDWLCLGRFDADPTLLGLLDAGRGGHCTVAFGDGLVAAGRRYLTDTNVLETRFHGATADVVVIDFMPVKSVPHLTDVGPDSVAFDRLVRIVRCERGRAAVEVRFEPRFDWGRRRTRPELRGHGAVYPSEELAVASSAPIDIDDEVVRAATTLTTGQSLCFVIGRGNDLDADVAQTATRELAETSMYWRAWSGQCSYRGVHAAMALRSALCLKLLTYAPTGGMIAAPTAGLPEVVGGVRNWDYRYVWTRDASFSVSAFVNLGFRREAAEFLRFLSQACDHGEAVRVMYAVDGPLPETRELKHLAGWRASSPITVGNDASEQDQFEIYGELLAALGLYVDKFGLEGLCEELVAAMPDFVVRLVTATIAHWRQPDQGIWELKGPPRHLVHTKAMCWVALDRAIMLAPRIGLAVPAHWANERDTIRADCLAQGWNADKRSLTMEYGGIALDMASLRLPLLQVIDANDPRVGETLAAMDAELGHGDLYRRYRIDDGLPGEEGAFVACSFWMGGVRLMRGETERGAALIESLLARANALGLFAEQMAPDGAHLGNFPQGFTHMGVIHEILRLDEALDPAVDERDRDRMSSGQGA